ncbi:MAG: transglycosylase SLT domain-containing protein [Aminivibrio sp.]|jgi:hypothetical protein
MKSKLFPARRAAALVATAVLLVGLFAGALSAEEYVSVAIGRRAAIDIMAREISAAMAPWKIPGPIRKGTEYSRHIWDACEEYNVDPFLVAALICVESQGRVNAVTQNRVGLMQVDVQDNMAWITKHFPHIKTVKTLMKARYNVTVGTFALSAARQGTRSEKRILFKYFGDEDEKRVEKIFDVKNRMNAAAAARF